MGFVPMLSLLRYGRISPGECTGSFIQREKLVKRDGDVGSALRLAQTFVSNLGRTSLNEFLSRQIRDDDFNPGEAHSRLLSLRWRDIFTTNWDTLLERSNSDADNRYDLVLNEQQLPQKNHPRIVKLHGSLPAHYPLIVTEEDYRTYLESHALFVNTIRQAMVETVFCLVGFSGKDPNFLQWSGWVRDHLREATQKIYLVGWLKLDQQERAVLQDLNVVPIDISNHPQAANWPANLCHQYAIEWFLHTLDSSTLLDEHIDWPSPSESTTSNIPEHLLPIPGLESGGQKNHPVAEVPDTFPSQSDDPAGRAKSVVRAWTHNRKLYPGWLAFPFGRNRSDLSRRTDEWEPQILNVLPELTPVERLKAVREILWRREILLEPISAQVEAAAQNALDTISWEHQTIDRDESPEEDWAGIRLAWEMVALALLTAARLEFKQQRFEELVLSLRSSLEDSCDAAHRVHQERCLWALYAMDFESLNELLDSWEVLGCDPVWMLRKASLLTEIRRYDESRLLVQEALDLIRSDAKETRRISNASREGWALGSMLSNSNSKSVFRRWEELTAQRAHAWDEIAEIERLLNRNPREFDSPAYDLGIARSTTVRWSNESYQRIIASFRAIRLSEVTGLPPVNFPESNFPLGIVAATGILKPAAEELIVVKPELAIKLALRAFTSENEKGLQRIVSRIHVARLQEDVVEKSAHACMNAIEFSLPRLVVPGQLTVNEFSIAKFRVACEVLSRLVMRLPPDMIDRVLDLGLKCYQAVPVHYWLARPTGNLLKRTWEALPKPGRTARVFDLLASPIAGLDNFTIETICPDPGRFLGEKDFPLERTADNDARIKESLDLSLRGLHGDESTRGRAIYRLIVMARSNFLLKEEKLAIAREVWGTSDPILCSPSGSHAPLDWTLFVLPELEEGRTERSFREKWLTLEHVEDTDGITFAANLVEQVSVAMSALPEMDKSLEFSEEDERHIATQVEYLAAAFCSESLRFSLTIGSQMRHLGPLVSRISIPDDIAESLYQKAEMLIEWPSPPVDVFSPINVADVRTTIAFNLIPGLIEAFPQRANKMIDWLRIGLASDNEVRVSNASSALSDWVSESDHQEKSSIPEDLLTMIGVIVASRSSVGLPHALSCAVNVFDHGTLDHRDAIGTLVLSGLRQLIDELKYDSNRHDDDLPTLRLLCVRLAKSMSAKGYDEDPNIIKWLDEGKNDPFPEVRRAATQFINAEDANANVEGTQ